MKRKVNHPPLLVAPSMPREVIEMDEKSKVTSIRTSTGLRRELNVLAAQKDLTYEELLWKMIVAYKKFGKEL